MVGRKGRPGPELGKVGEHLRWNVGGGDGGERLERGNTMEAVAHLLALEHPAKPGQPASGLVHCRLTSTHFAPIHALVEYVVHRL